MPSLKPRKVMSPPSLATAGRTLVSIRSLMVATVSASASLSAGHVVLHDGAEDCRLEVLPVAVVLGHGDEVGAVKYAGDARHVEQSLGERRARRGLAVGEFHGAAVEHGAAGDEFQGGGIGRGLGLNEHGFLRRRRFKAGA